MIASTRTGAPVLIVYALRQWPLRSTVEDHLYALRRHSRRPTVYLNLLAGRPPTLALRPKYAAVVFHTSYFASLRWGHDELLAELAAAVRPLERLVGVRVALPQDEFLRSEQVNRAMKELRIDHVCSVAPESEWPVIYDSVDHERVSFSRVLTGYLERATLDRIERLVDASEERDVAVGYRAWGAAAWLGRHGRLKADLAERVKTASARIGLPTDISTRDDDQLSGDDWFRFLTRCRYTIGVEGGASVLDRDGSIRERTDLYGAAYPHATFEEIESACFPGEDGRLDLRAISPRHLEACATQTCQILIEGHYNGILEADRHYIPLKSDLSNLDEVLRACERDDRREEIVQAAYSDIVTSGRYGYDVFAAHVDDVIDRLSPVRADPRPSHFTAPLGQLLDWASWRRVRWRAGRDSLLRTRAVAALVRLLPESLRRVLRRAAGRFGT